MILPAAALVRVAARVLPAAAQKPGDLPAAPPGLLLQDHSNGLPPADDASWFHDCSLEVPSPPGERRISLTLQQHDRAVAATKTRWPNARVAARLEAGGA